MRAGWPWGDPWHALVPGCFDPEGALIPGMLRSAGCTHPWGALVLGVLRSLLDEAFRD